MKARVFSPSPENLRMLGERLRKGELVAMPTETVYGLAGAALDPAAVARIFDAKKRPSFDPLIVHVSPEDISLERLFALRLVDPGKLSAEARHSAELLMKAFWPGPLTLVLPKLPSVPDLVTSGLSTVGVRMPAHPVAQALLREAAVPLAAPSANRFGRISPTSPQAVEAELGDQILWILDGGRSEVGLESTVVTISSSGEAEILRPGAVTLSHIVQAGVQGRLASQAHGERSSGALSSPGTLDSHYAPGTPLHLLSDPVDGLSPEQWQALKQRLACLSPSDTVGVLLMKGPSEDKHRLFSERTGMPEDRILVRSLSESGQPGEIAYGLFSALRELDTSGAKLLLSEPSPSQEGLGHAIADRLRRAAAK